MKWPTLFRTNEWWNYKLPSVFAAGYFIAIRAHYSLAALWPAFLLLLLSLTTGACYVSILNDYCDLQDDLAAGKGNRLATVPPASRIALLLATILSGIACFSFYLQQDVRSALLYLVPWVAFTLYSVPPFRFKKHPVAGIFADACGSQLFPSFTVVSFISFKIGLTVPAFLWVAIGLWALTLGLRGILWHQAMDGNNDLRIGFRSLIHSKSFREAGWLTQIIITVELAAFVILLATAGSWIPAVLLVPYLLYIYALNKKWGTKMIIIHPPASGGHRILLNDYYQIFLPIGLLLVAVAQYPIALLLAGFHLLLFWNGIYAVIREAIMLVVVPAAALVLSHIRKRKTR